MPGQGRLPSRCLGAIDSALVGGHRAAVSVATVNSSRVYPSVALAACAARHDQRMPHGSAAEHWHT
ncbi:Uncharacterised protein [Mycobacteroides abscessus subsp. massiliense]|nr:Uncharacterised protein [Mycobacteroides abscessus subsp. massiliense]